MLTNELSMRVARAYSGVRALHTRILLDAFVRRPTPVAAGGPLMLDGAVRAAADRPTDLPDRAKRGYHPQVGVTGAGDHLRPLGAPDAPQLRPAPGGRGGYRDYRHRPQWE